MEKTLKNISSLIAVSGSQLTPTDRRIAELVLAEPTLLAFGTVSDLAKRVNTSRPSIVRFATRLGLGGYAQLQELARSELSQRLTSPSERIRQGSKSNPSKERQKLLRSLDSVFQVVEEKQFKNLIQPIARAKNVWVLSGETSRAGAYAFRSGLSMIRPRVQLLEDRSIGQELSNVTDKDVVVVFDFYRYRKVVIESCQILADSGVDIVAITDGPLSPLVELTDNWCEIAIPALGPFDSSVPVVAMAESLVAGIAKALKQQATTRIDRIESLWKTTGTYYE